MLWADYIKMDPSLSTLRFLIRRMKLNIGNAVIDAVLTCKSRMLAVEPLWKQRFRGSSEPSRMRTLRLGHDSPNCAY